MSAILPLLGLAILHLAPSCQQWLSTDFRNVQLFLGMHEISLRTQKFHVSKVASSGADIGIFQVNIMAPDALTPCVARSSATMVLTMQDEYLQIS